MRRFAHLWRLAPALLALISAAGTAIAQPAPPASLSAPSPTPPPDLRPVRPANPLAGTTPMAAPTLGKPAGEAVVVIAKRRDRSWRSQITEHLNQPLASEAARPRHSFETEKPYCNSALRTVGGQPSNAADLMVGGGAGGC